MTDRLPVQLWRCKANGLWGVLTTMTAGAASCLGSVNARSWGAARTDLADRTVLLPDVAIDATLPA